MDALLSVPYLLRVILSLVSILLFQKLLKRLDLAMVLGILILAIWTGNSPGAIARIAGDRIVSLDSFLLVLVIVGVILLSALMSESGIMKDLVVSLQSRLNRRAILAALPMVVGLLPMPAGALFSAPLVDDADVEKHLPPLLKSDINFWFRHGWEFWWPLYPGVLLAIDLSGMSVLSFGALMAPMFVAYLVAGYLFLLRQAPPARAQHTDEAAPPFFPLVLPTFTIIVVYGVILVALPSMAQYNKYLPMVIGVVASLVVIQVQRPNPLDTWKRCILSKRLIGLVVIIVLARVYGAFVEARLEDGEFLMAKIQHELDVFGIPSLILVVVVPFISGLTTGITVGYIGASFPVVLSLAGPSQSDMFSTIILGYASGFMGMMLSPIHVCLIVTNEYFRTSLYRSLGGLLKPVLFVFTFAALYSYVWSLA